MAVLAVLLDHGPDPDDVIITRRNYDTSHGANNVTSVTFCQAENLPEVASYWQQVSTLQQSQYITRIGVLARQIREVSSQAPDQLINNYRFQKFSDTLTDLIYHSAISNFTLGDLEQDERLIVKLNNRCQPADANWVDQAIETHRNGNYDYCSHSHPHSHNSKDAYYIELETITFEVIQEVWQQAVLTDERQKIMPYLYRRQHCFNIGSF